MRYEELDQVTRAWMLEEIEGEEAENPYRNPALSKEGLEQFPHMLREAIVQGGEESLAEQLSLPRLWAQFEPHPKGGIRRVEPTRAAVTLARLEFNTWYIRGLCRRLLSEGEELCQVYRAWDGDGSLDECDILENKVLPIGLIYRAHRAKYHPVSRPEAFSIPSGPGCKHSIRRLSASMKALIEYEERELGGSFRKRR